MSGHGALVFVREVHPERDAHHVEAEYVGIMRDLDVFPVVGEVDHRAQVQILLRVGEDLREHVVRVEHAVRIGRHRHHARGAVRRLEAVERRRVAVVVVDVAAHDVQHDEIVLRRIELREVRQQRLVVLVGEVVRVVRPLRVIGCLGDERDRAVVLPVAPLVAEPPRLIARLFCDVDNRGGAPKLLVVVLALLRERALQDGHGLRPARVGVLEEEEMAVGALFALPRRIFIREIGRINLHIIA